jgi:hypothetical protein
MPRSLSDPLFERLLRSFPPDRAYTRDDWDDDAMPEPVAHFLGQLLAYYSRREARRLRRARSDWVNYDHPEMEQAVRAFFKGMEAHTQVPPDEWEETLHQATRHTTAYLVRPVYVLTDFVFGDREDALRLSAIRWRMNFFGPYSYLRESVNAFAKKKDLDAVGPDRFEQFLHHMDERVTSGFDADRWLRLLDPLFQVARRATDRERIPVVLLQTFFAEKSAEAIHTRLKRYEEEGHEEVGPNALYRLIEEAEAPPASPESASPTQTTEPSSPDQKPAQPSSSSGDDSSPQPTSSDDEIWGVAGTARPAGSGDAQSVQVQGKEGATPLWKQFQQGRAGSASDEGTDGGSEGHRQPLWAQFRQGQEERVSNAVSEGEEAKASASDGSDAAGASASTPSARESTEDLETLEREILGTTDPPHRAVYVRQLFGGDETAYRQVLRRLRTADSWGEASQIIASDVFRAHKVNIYSDAAVHFTNAVESRFREQ